MRKRWSEGAAVKMHQQNDRVRGDHEMNEDGGKVKDVLHWVHRHSSPGADMNVAVMEAVDRSIERFPVEESMDKVEMG